MNGWMIAGNIALLIFGFVLLVKGADWFVDSASALAERFGIPQIIIGLTIVACGTSLPETAVSLTAAVKGSADIAVGNVLGSNIANILLILGICGLVGKLPVQKNTLWIEIPFTILITVAVLLMGAFDGKIGRVDGAILVTLFVAFLVYLVISAKKGHATLLQSEENEEVKERKGIPTIFFLLVVGVVMIIGGSQFAVMASRELAQSMGLSESFIGLTVIAFGTSLPELITSVVATRKHKSDLAIGNIVGSCIFNILFVLGLTSLISPVAYAAGWTGFLTDNLVAIGAALALFAVVAFSKDKRLKKLGGGFMLLCYCGYFAYLIVKDIA